jgi:secernin
MCDTLCGPGEGGMVFAKNSDRPAGEVQLTVPFGRRNTAGGTLRTQYLSIGDTGAHAALLSIPTWLWGAEHGVNEYGVAIGNERVATVHDAARAKPALIGMDLVRLGLERARTAQQALEVMTDLLATHGQGGIADAAHQESYDSSFLIADATSAFVLETSGSDFAAAPFRDGTAISNRLTLGTEWTVGSPSLEDGEDFDRFRDHHEHTGYADVRLAASRRLLAAHDGGALTPANVVGHLRDHGDGPWGPGDAPRPPPTSVQEDFSGVSICMHVRGKSVTTASMIAVLPPGAGEGAPLRAYVALGSPCVSVYVPAFPSAAAGPPGYVPRELASEALWRAADDLRRRVEDEPEAIVAIREVLDPVEGELWHEAREIADRPDLWAPNASTWGARALSALRSALA